MKNFANFLFEANALKRIKRTGWQILGVKDESIAEHMWMAAVCGYVLAKIAKADVEKVVLMSLFHNFYEARLGDLNSINKLYLQRKKGRKKAEEDIFSKLPFGKETIPLLREYEERKTREAKLAKDASQLAFLIQLKEFAGQSSKEAEKWFDYNKKLFYTNEAKKLVKGKWEEAQNGRKRRYYSITSKGKTQLAKQKQQLGRLYEGLELVFGAGLIPA